MNKNEILNNIRQILSNTFDIQDFKETDNLFKDLGFDSLDYAEFLLELSKKLNIDFDYSKINNCKTINDLIKVYETFNCS